MRQVQDLKAEARSGTGKGPSYQTRQKGFIPGVLYGGKNLANNLLCSAAEIGIGHAHSRVLSQQCFRRAYG